MANTPTIRAAGKGPNIMKPSAAPPTTDPSMSADAMDEFLAAKTKKGMIRLQSSYTIFKKSPPGVLKQADHNQPNEPHKSGPPNE
ncbi:hypothetical protein FRC03_009110 [Tulasnella sp. 419]|nr:hypothetical protein FRC02_011624 [Tulasnella sp. 418]KAG8958459.1 hypothetical protein FRC03_009110 [Tulasnella sp. 419]